MLDVSILGRGFDSRHLQIRCHNIFIYSVFSLLSARESNGRERVPKGTEGVQDMRRQRAPRPEGRRPDGAETEGRFPPPPDSNYLK